MAGLEKSPAFVYNENINKTGGTVYVPDRK